MQETNIIRQDYIIGHEKNFLILKKAILNNKLPHNLLFYGNEGTGKASFALKLARYILAYPNLKKFEDKAFILRIKDYNHPDLFILQPAYNEKLKKFANEIKVEDTANLIKFLAHVPLEANKKLVIIDSVDKLNENAANSLLKSLEDVDKSVVFLIICHNLNKILPTILSRSIKFKFNSPTYPQIKEYVDKFLPQLELYEVNFLLRYSNNIIGKIFQLHENQSYKILDNLTDILQKLPLYHADAIYEFYDKNIARNNQIEFSDVLYLLHILLSRAIKYYINILHDKDILDIEQILFEKIKQKADLEKLIELNARLAKLISDEKLNYLDKRNLFLSLLMQLKA